MEDAVQKILEHFEIDLNDPNFIQTPGRYKRALEELLIAKRTPSPELRWFPAQEAGDMVFSSGLTATSLCPHHLFPYLMEAYFAYVPKERVVGVSKPGRLLRWLCGNFILQEAVGPAFLKIFDQAIEPRGSIILIKGVHLCATIRGAKQSGGATTTIASSGIYRDQPLMRKEFLDLVRQK